MPVLTKKRRIKRKISVRQQKKLSFLFIFAFLMLVFLLVINFADIFSGIITHKGSLFTVTKIETLSYSVYGVSIKDFANEIEAENYADEVAEKGGAGYVYQSGEYFVLGNAYQSLNEATEIKANLKELGYNARIVNIKVDAISKSYRGSNLKLLTSCINWFRNCYNNLYEEGLNFDKKLSNKNQVNSVIAKDLTSLSQLTNELNSVKSNNDKEIKEIILPYFKLCKILLEDILYSNSDNLIYSAELKHASIVVVLHNRTVVKLIEEL